MNRTLTAAVALAAALGTVGLAQAQMSPSTASPSSNPAMQAPAGTAAPNMTTTPSPGATTMPPSGAAGSYGNQTNPGPQANRASPAGPAGSAMSSPSTIQQAQQELKSQGLYNGPIDGVPGPETKTAVSQFQRQQGLPATAMLDQQTLDRLMSRGSGTASPNANR